MESSDALACVSKTTAKESHELASAPAAAHWLEHPTSTAQRETTRAERWAAEPAYDGPREPVYIPEVKLDSSDAL